MEKKMRKMIVLAAAMTLMSCSGGGETVAPADNQATLETGAAAQVAKLDDEQRNGVLERAIRASGAPCPAVTGSERTEVRHGVKGWKAQCNDSSAHLIEILSDGTAKVTSRTH